MLYSKIITKIKSKALLGLLSFIFLCPFSMQAMRNKQNDQSLYENMEYKKMCDQRSILAKCPNILRAEGLKPVEYKSSKIKQIFSLDQILHTLLCGCYQKYKKHDALRKVKKYDKLLRNLNNTDNSIYSDSSDDNERPQLFYKGKPEGEISITIKSSNDIIYKELDNTDLDDTNNLQDESEKNEQLFHEASKTLDKALVEDFWDKKQIAMKKTLGSPTFSTGVYLLAIRIVSALTDSETGKGIGSISTGWIIANAVERFSRAFYSINVSPLSDDLEEYEKKYAKYKRFLKGKGNLHKKIEENFSLARKDPREMRNAVNFSKVVLNLPLKSKRLKSPVDCEKEIDQLLGYNIEKRKKIISAFYNHYKRFSRKARPLESPKTVLYLQGPPGVGKTYITRQIAKTMGTEPIELRVGGDISHIIGNDHVKGSLLDSLTTKGTPKNVIIFIDEIDKVLNKKNAALEFFLPLLNPDEQYFYSPYLKAKIDLSHACIITAGNEPIEHEAVKSRLETVVLEKLDKKTKQKVIDTIIKRELGKKPGKDLVREIDWLVEKDKSPGVRELRRDVYNKIRQWQEQEERKQKLRTKRNEELLQIKNEGVSRRFKTVNNQLKQAHLERIEKRKKLIEDKKNK